MNQCVDLLSYVKTGRPKSFMDVVFLVDAFRGCQIKGDFIIPSLSAFQKIPVVDEILQDSNGILMWHHQLEALFGLFVTTGKIWIKLRRCINHKRFATFTYAEKLMLDNGSNLSGIIWERMVFKWTCYPSYKKALEVAKKIQRETLFSHYVSELEDER